MRKVIVEVAITTLMLMVKIMGVLTLKNRHVWGLIWVIFKKSDCDMFLFFFSSRTCSTIPPGPGFFHDVRDVTGRLLHVWRRNLLHPRDIWWYVGTSLVKYKHAYLFSVIEWIVHIVINHVKQITIRVTSAGKHMAISIHAAQYK